MSKTETIAHLIRAGRPDLANHVAYAAVRKHPGSSRDDADYPPDLVFDAPDVDAKLFWYRPGREDESAGLYVEYKGWEWWWWDVDARKAEKIANQVVDVLEEVEDDPDIDVRREMQRLGAR